MVCSTCVVTHADYVEWRQRGCVGWGWASVLPSFNKSEHQERGGDEFYGSGGPFYVSNPRRHDELVDKLIEAAIQAGYPARDDFNAGEQERVGYFQSTTGKSRRWSSATACLKPARGRVNLAVQPNSHAPHIPIKDGRATGVKYRRDGLTLVA